MSAAKRKPRGPRTERFPVMFTPEELEVVKVIAWRLRMDVATMVRYACAARITQAMDDGDVPNLEDYNRATRSLNGEAP